MAFRMQSSAPELMDLSKESKETLDLYGAVPGKPSFANNCLLARRLVERGVRFVQLYHEAWDQHEHLVEDIAENCRDTDQACAGLHSRPKAARHAGRYAGDLGRGIRPHPHGAGQRWWRRQWPRPSSQRLYHVACGRRN